jgi:hypothetical protein
MATGVGTPLDRVKIYEDGPLADAAGYPGQGFAFRFEGARQRLAAALADHAHDLARAGLVLGSDLQASRRHRSNRHRLPARATAAEMSRS